MSLDDRRIEAMLRAYRPAGPPARLREGVMAQVRPRSAAWDSAGAWAVAALLLLCLGLHWFTGGLLRKSLTTLCGPPAAWSRDAEEAASLLGGNRRAHEYLRLALTMDHPRLEPMSGTAGMRDL
jgi:hypothetical protein